ncbi:MAG: FG-GAP repeat protein [Frankiaceae bacterium]|nr:FG-GAP repeat protein [Frankiaceae bacterium]MBV9870659.1 FG-GAP repeat protein [Frankiaceae bacterium]
MFLVIAAGAAPSAAAHEQRRAPTAAHHGGPGVPGDIDGDGRSDLVVSVHHGFRIVYTRWTVHHSHVVTMTLPDNANPSSLAVADFNHDGHADVAAGNPNSGYRNGSQTSDGSIDVYDGTSHGLVAEPHVFLGTTAGGYAGEVVADVDLNHDKYSDLLAIPDQRGGLTVLLGGPSGLTPASTDILGGCPTRLAEYGGQQRYVATGDINGDGRSDLVIGQPEKGKQLGHGDDFRGVEGEIKICYGNATGIGPKVSSIHGRAVGSGYRELGWTVAVAHVNGDRFDDIVAGAPFHEGDNGRVAVVYGAKHGPIASRSTVADQGGRGPRYRTGVGAELGDSVTAGDVNGDGFSDVVAGGPMGGLGKDRGGEVMIYYGGERRLHTKHSIRLTLGQTFPHLTGGPRFGGDGFGSMLVCFNPRGPRFASVGVLAPGYAVHHKLGLLVTYPGSKTGVDVSNATRTRHVGQYMNYSTGLAIGA